MSTQDFPFHTTENNVPVNPFLELKFPKNSALQDLSPRQLRRLEECVNGNFTELLRSTKAMADAMREASGEVGETPLFYFRLVELETLMEGLVHTKENSQLSLGSTDITCVSEPSAQLDETKRYQQELKEVLALVKLLIPRFCKGEDNNGRNPTTYSDGRNTSLNGHFFFQHLICARDEILKANCNESIDVLLEALHFGSNKDQATFKRLKKLLSELKNSISYTYVTLRKLISAGTPDGVEPKDFMNKLSDAFTSDDSRFLGVLHQNIGSFVPQMIIPFLLKRRTPEELATGGLTTIGFEGQPVDLPEVMSIKAPPKSLSLVDSSPMDRNSPEMNGEISSQVLALCLIPLICSDPKQLQDVMIERGRLYQSFWRIFISNLDAKLGANNPFEFSIIGLTPGEESAFRNGDPISQEGFMKMLGAVTLMTPVWVPDHDSCGGIRQPRIITTHKDLSQSVTEGGGHAFFPLFTGHCETTIMAMIDNIFYKKVYKAEEYHVADPAVLDTLVTMIPNSEIELTDRRTPKSLIIDGACYSDFTARGMKKIRADLMDAIYWHSLSGTLISNGTGLIGGQNPSLPLLGGSYGLSRPGAAPATKAGPDIGDI